MLIVMSIVIISIISIIILLCFYSLNKNPQYFIDTQCQQSFSPNRNGRALQIGKELCHTEESRHLFVAQFHDGTIEIKHGHGIGNGSKL